MSRKDNSILGKIKVNEIAFGTWVQMSSPEIVEVTGYQGYDFAIIDMEHGHFGFEEAYAMIRAADASGVTPVVRIPNSEESTILKILDMGAMGVIVPGVSNKQEAEKVVRAAKYAPLGNRGACPWTRSTEYCVDDWDRHAQWSNQNTMIWLTIENEAGAQNIDEILSVSNIDAVMIGSFDLSQTIGQPGCLNHPELVSVRKSIVEKVLAKNINLVSVMLSESEPEELAAAVKYWKEQGSHIMIIGGDRGLLSTGFNSVLTAAKKALI